MGGRQAASRAPSPARVPHKEIRREPVAKRLIFLNGPRSRRMLRRGYMHVNIVDGRSSSDSSHPYADPACWLVLRADNHDNPIASLSHGLVPVCGQRRSCDANLHLAKLQDSAWERGP